VSVSLYLLAHHSTLFADFVFKSGKTESLVKWLFAANGILGILTPVAYAMNLPGGK
jgi:hypothetical protein